MTAAATASRQDALRDNLAAVRHRIDLATEAAGRSRGSVTLTAITKTYPATDIAILSELGVTDIGEARVQEASAKRVDLGATPTVRWHLIGQLQRNKVNPAVAWADVVESVDRVGLVAPLARAAQFHAKNLDVLIQVDLDNRDIPDRGGVNPDQVGELADLIATQPGLTLAGVMAVAPLGVDPARAFERLVRVHADLLANHPGAVVRSAGMSGDLERAIAAGATHVRIGTALLGSRPVVGYGA